MKALRTKLLNKTLELEQITPESRKHSAVVLEVLAGVRTPDQACAPSGISLPTYYNLETRALRGLIWSVRPNLSEQSQRRAEALALSGLQAFGEGKEPFGRLSSPTKLNRLIADVVGPMHLLNRYSHHESLCRSCD